MSIRRVLSSVALALWSTCTHAIPITYTESALGYGVLGGTQFANQLVTITFVGDTSHPGLCTGVPNCTVDDVGRGTATVSVAGVGTATVTDTTTLGEVANNGSQGAGISDF